MSAAPRTDYDCFEDLIRQLRVADHPATAEKLDLLLHHVTWTTGSELMGELGSTILAFQRNATDISAELHGTLSDCMSIVRKYWPDIS